MEDCVASRCSRCLPARRRSQSDRRVSKRLAGRGPSRRCQQPRERSPSCVVELASQRNSDVPACSLVGNLEPPTVRCCGVSLQNRSLELQSVGLRRRQAPITLGSVPGASPGLLIFFLLPRSPRSSSSSGLDVHFLVCPLVTFLIATYSLGVFGAYTFEGFGTYPFGGLLMTIYLPLLSVFP